MALPPEKGTVGIAIRWIAGAIAAFWLIELVDSFVLSDRLQRGGIHPRSADGVDGILWAPLLHSDWRHLVSNTFPFAVLGGLVAVRGIRRLAVVTAATVLVGGGLTWLLGSSGNHIGASGLIFGYFGALLGAAIFERRPLAIAPALVALLLYSGLVAGFVPTVGVSWEGHLFGFLGGLLCARWLADRTPRFEWQAEGWTESGGIDPYEY